MLRLLLIGFGNVGRELVRLLSADHEVFHGFNQNNFKLTGIVTRNHGNVFNPQGLDGREVLESFVTYGRFDPDMASFTDRPVESLLEDANYDVLVELSSLDLEDKAQSTTRRITQALRLGKHVVTANKGPIAFHYQTLKKIALDQNRQLLFESTVMDGTPVFNLFKNSLKGAEVVQFSGILNSTTNFLLSKIEEGLTSEQALDQARKLGIVEADADHDLQGWDAALKTAILCNVFFNTQINPFHILRDSFDQITPGKIKLALQANKRWKFVASGTKESAEVRLKPITADHPFFNIQGTSNILQIQFNNLADLMIVQDKPTITDTAYGVINDLLEILQIERNET